MADNDSPLNTWSLPSFVTLGAGAATQVGAWLARQRCRRAAVFTVSGEAIYEDCWSALSSSQMPTALIEVAHQGAGSSERKALAERVRAEKCDALVVFGGDALIDTVKALRLVLAQGEDPLVSESEAARADCDLRSVQGWPLLVVPTEVACSSALNQRVELTYPGDPPPLLVVGPALVPDGVWLDDNLLGSNLDKDKQSQVLAEQGFELVALLVESYLSLHEEPMCDAIALAGLHAAVESLRTLIQGAFPTDLRVRLGRVALMAGAASRKGLGACHSLAHPLETEAAQSRGRAKAICLPAVVDFNRSVVSKRVASIARQLGVRDDSEKSLAYECSGSLRQLRKDLSLAGDLGSVGLEEASLPALAKQAAGHWAHRTNPRSCGVDDLLALYRASL